MSYNFTSLFQPSDLSVFVASIHVCLCPFTTLKIFITLTAPDASSVHCYDVPVKQGLLVYSHEHLNYHTIKKGFQKNMSRFYIIFLYSCNFYKTLFGESLWTISFKLIIQVPNKSKLLLFAVRITFCFVFYSVAVKTEHQISY